ncbi:MAG: hypothetical protein JRC92_11430 [Deltaproteobacteria bacterium]|nr:hypothetical protein [Deltaproteobacteria bacterium]
MAKDDVRVNGERVAWANIAIDLGYGEVVGAQEISWDESQEKKSRYGKGSKPIGSSKGNYEASASLVIDQDEFQGPFMDWVKGNGKTNPLEVEGFRITVAWTKTDGSDMHTVRLPQCEINKVAESVKQGDTEATVSIDLTVHQMIERE